MNQRTSSFIQDHIKELYRRLELLTSDAAINYCLEKIDWWEALLETKTV